MATPCNWNVWDLPYQLLQNLGLKKHAPTTPHWCTSSQDSRHHHLHFQWQSRRLYIHSISFELEILHISRWHRRIMAAPKIILNETMVSYPSQKFHSHPPWTRQLVGGSKVYPYMAHLHSSRRGRQFLVPPEPCHLQSLRRRTWMSPLDVDSAYQTFHRVESDTVIYRAIVNQRKLRKAWQKYLLNHLFSWWCLRSQRFCWWTKSCVPGMYATLWKWVLYLGKHHLNQGSWGRIIVIFDTNTETWRKWPLDGQVPEQNIQVQGLESEFVLHDSNILHMKIPAWIFVFKIFTWNLEEIYQTQKRHKILTICILRIYNATFHQHFLNCCLTPLWPS